MDPPEGEGLPITEMPQLDATDENAGDGKVKERMEKRKSLSAAHRPESKKIAEVFGGLQIKRNQTVFEHPSKVKIGGLSHALIDIPSAVMNHLHPKKQIDVNEPVFPTQSRINRVVDKKRRRETCSDRLERRLANFDLWAIQNVPHSDVLAFNICVVIAPVLLVLTVWDLLAVVVFFIPHMSFLNFPGFLYPFYTIGTVSSFYGYMMRFLMEDYSPKTYVCYAGVIVYPTLLIARCLLHYFFNEYRNEKKLWY